MEIRRHQDIKRGEGASTTSPIRLDGDGSMRIVGIETQLMVLTPRGHRYKFLIIKKKVRKVSVTASDEGWLKVTIQLVAIELHLTEIVLYLKD